MPIFAALGADCTVLDYSNRKNQNTISRYFKKSTDKLLVAYIDDKVVGYIHGATTNVPMQIH